MLRCLFTEVGRYSVHTTVDDDCICQSPALLSPHLWRGVFHLGQHFIPNPERALRPFPDP